jgi:hypothetical protein
MSCLFQSLSYFLAHKDYGRLRQDICNFLESNQPLVDDLTIKDIAEFEGIDKDTYIQNMRNDNTWGGAPEIKAFCEMYNVIVKVIVKQSGKLIEFKPSNTETTRFVVITWSGNHFEPFVIEQN